VLDRLDEIPWKRLHHAYGAAEDVPGLLRGLVEPERQEEALFKLFGNIWHQGTVYEASSYAVPFLLELVVEPAIPGRDRILGLVGALAEGKSYLDVHAQPGVRSGEFWRQKPDFEDQLRREMEDVQRAREAVRQGASLVCTLLTDEAPMVRAGAAYVLSRFPEHAKEFGPLLRNATSGENNSLTLAALLWCLGAIRDASPEAECILEAAIESFTDPRQAFAATIALYRIRGELGAAALPICRMMASAKWFAEVFLVPVPWDFSAEFHPENLLDGVEPDSAGATRMLLAFLRNPDAATDSLALVVHDLIELNFGGREWRRCAQLTSTQAAVLRGLIETDAAWQDTKRLWFLIPGGIRRASTIQPADIKDARDTMRSVLDRADISP
jgi:hypothetical protein